MNALALITATIEPGSTSLAQQLKAIGFQQMPASRTYANYGHTDSGDYMDTRVGYLRPRVRVWMSRGLRGGPDTVFVCVLGLTVWLGDFQETQAAEIVAAARKALKLYKLIVSERDRVLLYGSEDLVVRLVHHYYPNIAVSTIKKDLCDVKTGGLRGLPRNVAEATVEPQQATVSVAARMLMAVTGHTRVTKASFWEVLEGGPDYVKVYITPHSSDAKLCGGIRVDILGAIELVLKPGDRISTFVASIAKTLALVKEVAASLPLVHDYADQAKVDTAYHTAGLLQSGKHISIGYLYKLQKDAHVTATVEPGDTAGLLVRATAKSWLRRFSHSVATRVREVSLKESKKTKVDFLDIAGEYSVFLQPARVPRPYLLAFVYRITPKGEHAQLFHGQQNGHPVTSYEEFHDHVKKLLPAIVQATVEPAAPHHVFKNVEEIVDRAQTGHLKLPSHVSVQGKTYSVAPENHALRLHPVHAGSSYQFEGLSLDKDVSDEDADGWDFEIVHRTGGSILVAEINRNPKTGLQTTLRKLEACFG